MLLALKGKRQLDKRLWEEVGALLTALQSTGGITLVAETRYASIVEHNTGLRLRSVDSPEGADMALSIGGDGTLLRTARWVAPLEIPILGVNSGHLGYLTAATLDNPVELANAIAGGRFSVERRTMLHVEPSEGKFDYPYALNEVAVLRDETASMITVHASLDGKALASYPADGLIISTPTGSTGYNLSVGGPIVAPNAGVWTVSPVAAHALTMRPLVVADTSVVGLKVVSRVPHYRVSLDGNSMTLPLEVTLKVSKAPFDTLIARPQSLDFPTTLRTKLMWGIDPR